MRIRFLIISRMGIQDLKQYYKVTVIKIVWYLYKNRNMSLYSY